MQIDDRVGQQLGNYRLVRLLRRGSFAEVYLARQVYLETLAAIKILHQQLGNEERQTFLKEARTIAHLVHPHIVRVLEFGVDGYTPFLVMDYAPRGTLRERYPKGTSLPLATVIAYVKQVAAALQYAHYLNLVHCDLKPENMLLGRHDEVLLSDFGIALAIQSSAFQEMQEPLGTLAYMAPEQIQGEPCPASDQYSLGIVVYEWLCGERPFQGSPTEIADQQLTASPPCLCERAPELPPDIEEVLAIALAKDPAKRFASVRAFANALEQASRLEPHLLPVPDFELALLPSREALTTIKLPPEEAIQLAQAAPETGIEFPIISGHSVSSRSVLSTPVFPQPLVQPKRNLSRRAVVAGLFGFALIGSGSAATLLLEHLFNRPSSTFSHTIRYTPGSTPSPAGRTPALTRTPAPSPLGTTLYTYRGHHEVVKAVAWNPDSSRIASASFDSTVQVWDAITGNHVLKYSQHTGGVKTVAWNPVWGTGMPAEPSSSPAGGSRIASGGLDKTVRVWDAATGKDVLPPYNGHSQAVRSVAWSPDSTLIASGSEDNTVQVWNASTGLNILTYRGHSDKVICVAWNPVWGTGMPDGWRIASASFDGTVQVWNAATDGNFSPYIYRGHFPNGVRALAWSPDGKYIASGGNDRTVQVWNAKTGQTLFTYRGHTREVEIVSWSPDARFLASGSFDATVKIWDTTTGHNIYTYTRHTDQVWAVAWSPQGQHIASGGNDVMVHVWQAI